MELLQDLLLARQHQHVEGVREDDDVLRRRRLDVAPQGVDPGAEAVGHPSLAAQAQHLGIDLLRFRRDLKSPTQTD